MTDCCLIVETGEMQTADPSTPLRFGRDDGLLLNCGDRRDATADPSTPLRFGRDDRLLLNCGDRILVPILRFSGPRVGRSCMVKIWRGKKAKKQNSLVC
jgi:hypothetical protein